MTPQERKVLEEAEQQALETSQQLNESLSTGIRPPPQVDNTEVTLEGALFGLEFGGEPTATAAPGATAPPSTELGVCCVDGDCSITTEEDCMGIWVEGFTCDDVICCTPYFEVHVQLVTCGTEAGSTTCEQTIDLTAILDLNTIEPAEGCCTDQLIGTTGATDENGNSISLNVTSSVSGTLIWFVNITANCPTHYGCGFTGDTVMGDCMDGGTEHYDVNDSSGGGSCDGSECTAVGTVDIIWHG